MGMAWIRLCRHTEEKPSHAQTLRIYFWHGVIPTSYFINPRRACAARVTVVVVFVCLSVCLSVMRELTSAVIDRVKNKVTYPAADGGQKICGIFSETALFSKVMA